MLLLGLEGWKKLINLVQLKSVLYLREALLVAVSEHKIEFCQRRGKSQQNNALKDIQAFIAQLLYTYAKKGV